MIVSAMINAARDPVLAARYRSVVADRSVLVSFVTITEMRYGALRARWGDFRRRALERDLAQFVVVQPDDDLIRRGAKLRADCEHNGHGLGQKIHEADRWIAATALRLDLVSEDAIFRGIPNLRLAPHPPGE